MSTHIKFVEKVEKAAEAISCYYPLFVEAITIDIEYNGSLSFVWEHLERLGISKDNEASHSLIAEGFCKEGDARKVFCEGDPPVIPVPWFRKIWAVLSDGQPTSTAIGKGKTDITGLAELIIGQRPASQWSDKALIEAYSTDCSGEIIDEFKKRADGKEIIAFEDESAGIVNVDITVNLLRESRRRITPKIIKISGNGKVYKLYTVGDFPSEIYEESPLAPGTLLFNGNCDVCGMDFSEISKEAKQFLRVAYNEGKTPKNSDRISLRMLISAAKSGLGELKDVFPEVGIVYDELLKTDELPSLKSVNSKSNGTVNSDPFGKGNKKF